ncbi:carotenoid cleavage dioxygenase 4a [Pyrus ussuriensis x Pyrus communis]|uniref:Carotenoid cleavage dioxygenase 4a n=1 Tax=Pyrus ussuriensis x Pyrus communis TaxID=2448454 RepID=A0A5N5HDQ3_9ROSA|nr:carotenoid cleavage dioxygenase 4a [Pyrus ussuriensis x Pyrus communis]
MAPNPQFLPRGLYHLFDCDGVVHCVRISGGRAVLCSRYVRTYKYTVERDAGHPFVPNFFSCFNGLAAFAVRTLLFAARILTDIETLGRHDFEGKLSMSMTAHPKIDPETGRHSPSATAPCRLPRIGVIPRYAKDESGMRWFDVPGFNIMHAINAWDEDDDDAIVMLAPNVNAAIVMLAQLHCCKCWPAPNSRVQTEHYLQEDNIVGCC